MMAQLSQVDLTRSGSHSICAPSQALRLGVRIVLMHELRNGKGATPFETLWADTPHDLKEDGIYDELAVPLCEVRASAHHTPWPLSRRRSVLLPRFHSHRIQNIPPRVHPCLRSACHRASTGPPASRSFCASCFPKLRLVAGQLPAPRSAPSATP